MATKHSVLPIAMSSINATALTTSYQAINAGGFTKSCILIRIVNDTSKNLTLSFDGINAHEFVQDGTVLQLPIQSNLALNSGMAQFKKGTTIYVKSDAAGTGFAYLVGYYQDN